MQSTGIEVRANLGPGPAYLICGSGKQWQSPPNIGSTQVVHDVMARQETMMLLPHKLQPRTANHYR